MSNTRALAELERTRANLGAFGVVTAVDHDRARAQVLMAGLASAWLPWVVTRAGAGSRSWNPPAVDEQVLIFCPDGNPANGVILGSIYQADFAAPAAASSITRTTWSDGAVIDYDTDSHAARLAFPAGATLDISSPGSVRITSSGQMDITAQAVVVEAPTITLAGATTVTGALTVSGAVIFGGGSGQVGTVNGDLQVTGNVTAAGVSLATHTHGGVQSGTARTGLPA